MKTKRQPIVVVLGHVDHGKTSLLDALRQTSIAIKEAGGITQSIGASVVTTKDNNKITFIDTPGHSLFSIMRSRGSKLADIALLVIDGSDGIKPQTREAITHINEAGIPFIVVVTKIDLSTASVDSCLQDLEKEGILFESRGGQTPFIGVSARKKEGLNELLDLINLLSEVNDIEGDSEAELEAVVIETSRSKGGNMVSAIVRNGKLSLGDKVFAGASKGKIKRLVDDQNNSLKKVLPGEPALILGFESLPKAGTIITNKIIGLLKEEKNNVVKIDKNKIPIFIKANSSGALEAIIASIPSEFSLIEASVGNVSESDVLNAKSSGAGIFVFESKVSSSAKKLAEAEKVKIEEFKIIYELLGRFEELVKKGLVEINGEAEIITNFPFDNKRVAGCKVVSGSIERTKDLKLYRNKIEIGKLKIISMKKQKQEITTASQGEEFGILFTPQLDFQTGDVLVSVK